MLGGVDGLMMGTQLTLGLLLRRAETLFPRKEWTGLSHRLIWHGRRVCHARRPACGACALARLCPSYGEGPVDPVIAAKAS